MEEQINMNAITLEDLELMYGFSIRVEINNGQITKILDKIGE